MHRLEGTAPSHVLGGLMLGVSIVSILVQGVCFAMLQPFDGHGDDKLNLRSALLHLASDLTLGVAVIVASAFVYFLHWKHADDWASIICCVLFIYMYVDALPSMGCMYFSHCAAAGPLQ